MNRPIALLAVLSWLFLSGCFFGDRGRVYHPVVLSIPHSGVQSQIQMSASDTNVQEAVVLIDGLLVNRGFVRESFTSWGIKNVVPIACYGWHSPPESNSLFSASILLYKDSLIIYVMSLSDVGRQTFREVRKVLAARYGTKSVKIGSIFPWEDKK